RRAVVGRQVNGIGRKAVKVPGTAALNKGDAQVNSVSCGSAGNCSAGGWYTDSRGYEQLMVVNQVNGIWQNAIEVPGSAALNKGDYARITSVSCGSAGQCRPRRGGDGTPPRFPPPRRIAGDRTVREP